MIVIVRAGILFGMCFLIMKCVEFDVLILSYFARHIDEFGFLLPSIFLPERRPTMIEKGNVKHE